MIAYGIDPVTHELIERWRWNDLGGEWHGQGYHNFGIADVDWDGRDEIVYGLRVIDDNGYGLSTTVLGHGLEWEFTGLHDATGILKEVEGTGVGMISSDEPISCTVFDVAGLRIGTVETTKAHAAEAARSELRLVSGLYLLHLEGINATESIKINY